MPQPNLSELALSSSDGFNYNPCNAPPAANLNAVRRSVHCKKILVSIILTPPKYVLIPRVICEVQKIQYYSCVRY